MSKYGKKQIYDLATNTLVEVDLTPEEILQRELDEKEYTQQQAEFAKNKYLLDRANDPNWPTLAEKVEALWYQDKTMIDAINTRIKNIEAKYPAGGA